MALESVHHVIHVLVFNHFEKSSLVKILQRDGRATIEHIHQLQHVLKACATVSAEPLVNMLA